MAGIEDRDQVDAVVIGGSQSGLAAGYHLKQQGRRSFVILEAGDRVGDAWRSRWDTLQLFTTARYDGLPGLPFPADSSVYPTKDDVADYLEAYAEHFRLPVSTGSRVDVLRRSRQGYELVLAERTIAADNVIVATGTYHTPRVPDFAHRLDPEIRQLHSSSYRNPAQLVDGPVLVVGAANSGAEIALDVSTRHTTWLSGRDPGQEPTRAGTKPDLLLQPVMWFMASRVLRVTNPLGRKVRDHLLDPPRGIPVGRARRSDIVAAGIERVPRTAGVQDGRPVLDDGRVLDVANVIWCTGFDVDLSWIDISLPWTCGFPETERGVVPSVPGLYFLGFPFLYSLSSALLGGVGRDAGYVVRHLAATRVVTPAVV